MSPASRIAALTTALALVSACGSTVPLGQRLADTTTTGLGTGTQQTTDPGGDGAGAGSGALTPGTNTATGGTTGAAGSTSAGAASLPPGSSAQQPVSGVSATTITIGFIYTTGRAEAAAALGAAGVTSGDELAQWKLLIQAVNKSGGLGGRQIKPVFFGEGTNTGQSTATKEAAACTAFTQDNHVAAALSSFEFTDSFMNCMNKHGVPTAYSLETLNSTSTYNRYPLQFEPGNLGLDRQGAELGSSLADQGYFAGTVPAVNGVITYDTVAYHAAVDALERSLKAHGIALKDKRFIPFPNESKDTGAVAAQVSSIELAFASEGVNHVMMFDLNGLLSLLFMTNAQSQQYHPRYGLTSQSSGTHLADLLKGNANAQLKDARGIGWIPVLDLASSEYGSTKGSPARKRCREIMIKGGQQQGLSSPGAELVADGQCDIAFMLQQAFQHLTGPVSGAALQTAVRALGTAFPPAGTFSTSFGTGRRDGVSTVRDVAYQTSCSCFRYTSALRNVA